MLLRDLALGLGRKEVLVRHSGRRLRGLHVGSRSLVRVRNRRLMRQLRDCLGVLLLVRTGEVASIYLLVSTLVLQLLLVG